MSKQIGDEMMEISMWKGKNLLDTILLLSVIFIMFGFFLTLPGKGETISIGFVLGWALFSVVYVLVYILTRKKQKKKHEKAVLGKKFLYARIYPDDNLESMFSVVSRLEVEVVPSSGDKFKVKGKNLDVDLVVFEPYNILMSEMINKCHVYICELFEPEKFTDFDGEVDKICIVTKKPWEQNFKFVNDWAVRNFYPVKVPTSQCVLVNIGLAGKVPFLFCCFSTYDTGIDVIEKDLKSL
jgi:hypothetical protein